MSAEAPPPRTVRIYSSFVGRAPRRVHRYTYPEYLAYEAASNVRHEYLDGEIYALVAGSPAHAALSMNVRATLAAFVRDETCVVRGSDLKVRATASGLTAYPDVTVICGPVETDALSDRVALNPAVLVEVTSPGTEDWDRGEKLDSYRQIPSLRECVIVSHRARAIDVYRRAPGGGWTSHSTSASGRVALPSLGGVLRIDDVYRDVDVGL
jgi:Uma2 family endonuclease